MSAQAGWYPDSVDPSLVRYWDGSAWTIHTHPRQVPEAALAPQGGALPAASGAADKVKLLGVRSQAKDLIAENTSLREALSRLGALSLVQIEQATIQMNNQLGEINLLLETKRAELGRLDQQILNVRTGITIQDVGLYDYEHPAESSTKLASRLSQIRQQIKEAVKNKRAIDCSTGFTFNNSSAEGTKFVNQMSAMMLSAYNAEAENCVKTVRAGSYATAKARLDRVVERVAKNGAMIQMRINPHYHRLRLEEIRLASEYLQVLAAEKEAERAHQAELREQKKAEAEMAREREKLNKEREHYLNNLAAARALGDPAKIAEAEAKLADTERAIEDVSYRQANIRAGYVYVISNIGAFGERMVKIGMTRRLDPMGRVHELGDASVPFRFDVHALFFADDAVAIEGMLHKEFADRRVNRVNQRREFFYCTPEEVLEKLKEHHVTVVEFRTDAAADEFRASRSGVVVAEESPIWRPDLDDDEIDPEFAVATPRRAMTD